MTDSLLQWQERHIAQLKASGKMCSVEDCMTLIGEDRVKWAERHGYAAPKYCYEHRSATRHLYE